jgi:hypothetical protein
MEEISLQYKDTHNQICLPSKGEERYQPKISPAQILDRPITAPSTLAFATLEQVRGASGYSPFTARKSSGLLSWSIKIMLILAVKG